MSSFHPIWAGALVALALASPVWGQDPGAQFDRHMELGNQAQRAGRYRESLSHYQAAINLIGQIPGGVKRPDDVFYNLSLAHSGLGNDEEEIKIYLQIEVWRRKNLGDDHPDTIEILGKLARAYRAQRNAEKDVYYLKEYLTLTAKRFGDESRQYADCLISACHHIQLFGKDPRDIEKLATQAVEIYEKHLGPRTPALRYALVLLSSTAESRGEYQRASELLDRLRTLDAEPGLSETLRLMRVSGDLEDRAGLFKMTGRFLESEAAFRESIEVTRQLPKLDAGTRLTLVAGRRVLLGDLYIEMGLPGKALEQFQRILTELAAVDRMDALTWKFSALKGISRAHHLRGELPEALKAYEEGLRITKDHADVQTESTDYAALLGDLGRYDEANAILEKAAVNFGRSGANSPMVLSIRLKQAGIRAAQDQRDAAEKLYQQVIDGAQAGASNPGVMSARMGQAKLAATAGDKGKAIALADKARREMRLFTRRVLPALGEHEQLDFLAHREAHSLADALAIALGPDNDAAALEASAGWILNAKGLAQEAIAQRTLQARGTKDPRLAAALREWLAVRYRLARLSLGGSASDEESGKREVAALTAREQALGARLGRSSSKEEADPWVELAAVRAQLPADGVLLEIFRYQPLKSKDPAARQASEYLVWVIPPAGKGKIELVRLGPCDAIDAAVVAARKPLLSSGEAIAELGEADAEKSLHKELAVLSEKLLGPLRPSVSGYRRWIISPDSSLWLVPWSALLTEKGKYLVESHVTSLVVSGRDVVDLAGRKASGNPSLVLADPDYDLADAASPGTGGGLRGARVSADGPQTSATRSAAVRSAVSTAWQRLPGTAREAKALEPKLAAYTGSTVELLMGREAGEVAVREAWQPRVAVLSTHGYFLDRGQAGENFALESPLVRCGLVLAGANRRGAAVGQGADDGILTGLEIVGADLRGTELVVLSACETALGEVRAAEGVAGVRQAFQLAGAQSVLASLWRVPDADTAQLMIDFYDRLAATGDKAGALAEAQLALLAGHRKAHGGAGHPFYWAAFTLTGRTDRPAVGAPEARPPVVLPRVQVVSATAPIMDGPKQVALSRRGEFLELVDEKGDWLLIKVAGRAQPAWIERKHVRSEE